MRATCLAALVVLGACAHAPARETASAPPVAVPSAAVSTSAAAPSSFILGGRRYTPHVPAPVVRARQVAVVGRMEPEIVRRIVHARLEPARVCYKEALARQPELAGRVEIELAIDATGAVTSARSTAGTTLPDAAVVSCVVDAVRSAEFPRPDGGSVTAVCPISFAPQ